MSRQREEIFFDKRRNMWVGKFWKLKKPGSRPPTKDLTEHRPDIEEDEINYIFQRTEKELIEREFGEGADSEPVLFSEASERWLSSITDSLAPRTLVEYKRAIKHWLQCNGDHPISMINSEANARFTKTRLHAGVSDATIQKDQRHLSVFWTWLYNEGLIERELHLRKRRVEKRQPEVYMEEDLNRMEALLQDNPQWMRVFMMARYAVMRAGEIWSLPLSRIDLRKKVIIVGDVPELDWTVKTRVRRSIPISKRLLPFLIDDLEGRAPNERWYLDNGTGFPGYASAWALTQIFRRKCAKLQIVGPKPLHGIRAAGITRMLLESGGRAELVASIAGHSVAVMLQHYAMITEEDSRGVIDLL